MKETFGNFITKKRESRGLGLREFARQTGISPEHLCNIEKDRRSAPPYRKQLEISKVLKLSKEETEYFLDLALISRDVTEYVAGDIVDYINTHENVVKTIRMARDNNISDDEWCIIADQIKNR